MAFVDFGPLAPRDPAAAPSWAPRLSSSPACITWRSPSARWASSSTTTPASDQGIRPFFCVNHGPTTSMYYRDPDGNRIELQIDNFATAEEGRPGCISPAFDQNPIGVEYDPDELVEKFRAGVPVAELVVRD